ncbi:Hybrid signal transduction histidine kinase K [Cytospora mali]|uniref:Hybrid signal transduction histidine kinase K n=1 Tax=Cytospora mali TaxID=578113 RepID=A0A194VBX5_CYTMA|nr:Hybrid signal transduction histidine kinase K [Valsa mali var. pyri (nom. inval.)]
MNLERDDSPRNSASGTSDQAIRPSPAPPLQNHSSGSFFSAPAFSSSLPSGSSTSHTLTATPRPFAHRQSGLGINALPSDGTIRLTTDLDGRRGSDISRYGLTAATTVRDQFGVGVSSSANHLSPAQYTLTSPPIPRPARPRNPSEDQSFARPSPRSRPEKRPSDQGNLNSAFRTPAKKPRRFPPGNLDLRALASSENPEALPLPDGVSPLFFSNSSKKYMTGRPAFFSASEPTSAMINRLHDDEDSVRTVRLPRGHFNPASPPRGQNLGTPGSGGSADSYSTQSLDNYQLPSDLRDLQGFGVIELLEQDERPTFIIDLNDPANFSPGPLKPIFRNASLMTSTGINELISENSQDSNDYARFKVWVVSLVKDSRSMDVCLPSLSYGGITWTCSTLRNRFRFVSGSTAAVSITPTSPAPLAGSTLVPDEQRSRQMTASRDAHTVGRERALSDVDYFGDAQLGQGLYFTRRAHSEPRDMGDLRPDTPVIQTVDGFDAPDAGFVRTIFDWTRIADIDSMTPHLRLARLINWSLTPLGPISGWSSDLRAMSNMIMGSPHPAAMYWGPEFTAIYNEAYIDLAGSKHPKLMGQSYTEGWAEIWDEMKPVFDAAWLHGQATMKQDDRLFISRDGYLEETFFNWSVVPLVGGDGSVVGLYNPAFENTRRKVNERRMLTLREVGERTSLARNVKGFWKEVQKGLEYNEWDIPFALIYSVSDDSESEISSMHSGSVVNPPNVSLEGMLGVTAEHPCAVASIDLKNIDQGFAPYMRRAMAQPTVPVVLSKDDGSLPQSLIEGVQWRGFGDPSRTIVVFPVHPTTGESVVGFIVLGVNPRRPYNNDYRLFINLLSRQMATSMASVVLFEEEIKRGQAAARVAALERQQLSLQLRLRTQEAVESEYKFSRMAEFAPVGIFIANAQGEINFCNDSWWEISRHPRSKSINTWKDSIVLEDRPAVEEAWRKLIDEMVSVVLEFRFQAARVENGHPIERWALMSAYPEKDSEGATKAIFGCITDISQQKWAEAFQKERRDEALELKRQQENFIDMTSHEMRNPLSALCQCADEIIGSVVSYRKTEPDMAERLSTMLETCLEAANTISLCANHQKRIVDDVLTLSRLDSKMVEVTPTVSKPLEVVEKSLKMFEAELVSNNIKADLRVDKSYEDMGVQLAKFDPARLQQVLINLLTNAIKFTQKREERSIIVTLGASKDVGEAHVGGIEYFQGEMATRHDITDRAEWGDGEKFNLHISVSDTGPGLTDEERAMLFQRFRQTSPRTHVEYGGSGLGLFISRMLTEMQGGQIGVLSTPGTGSTFAFYVKSRKAVEPQVASPSIHKDGTDMLSIQPAIDPSTVDVLVVEDNEVNQKVLGRLLRRCGFKAHLANHGGEAIDMLQRSIHWNHTAAAAEGYDPVVMAQGEETINVSIILMDLEMPVMDGFTCARKIRELERQSVLMSRVPIIAVTAYDGIVAKPFRAHDLTPKIAELLMDPPTGNTPHSPMSVASPAAEQPSFGSGSE